jgi:tetratricopeptide (TPR) repeat protein
MTSALACAATSATGRRRCPSPSRGAWRRVGQVSGATNQEVPPARAPTGLPAWRSVSVESLGTVGAHLSARPALSGRRKSPRRWASSILAAIAAFCAATLAIVTNWATALPIPGWLSWLTVGAHLWWLVVFLGTMTCLLAARTAHLSRLNPGDSLSMLSVGEHSVVPSGGTTIGSVTVQSSLSGVTVVAPGGIVALPASNGEHTPKCDKLRIGNLPIVPACFQARAELADIQHAFTNVDQHVPICSLIGLPGTGKTQLAAEYVRSSLAASYRLVGWVSAQTNDELVAGLADIACALGVADQSGDSMISAQRLRAYLQNSQDEVLLIFDNAADVDELIHYLPSAGCVNIIVTSVNRSFAELGHEIEVQPFSAVQSLSYLQARTGREVTEESHATDIAEALGHLPLALAQAASVIRYQQIDYATYLARLRGMPVRDVLPQRPGDPYPRGAADAILLSVESATKIVDHKLAIRILTFMSMLSPAGASRLLLRQLVRDDRVSARILTLILRQFRAAAGPTLSRLVDYINDGQHSRFEIRVDETLERLVALSLLSWDSSASSVIIHPLTARVIREQSKARGARLRNFAKVAKQLGEQRMCEHEFWKQRELGAELVRHALTLWELSLVGTDPHAIRKKFAICAPLVNWSARFLTEVGDLLRAVEIGQKILADCGRILSESDGVTLSVRHTLAFAYRSAEDLNNAITLYEEIFQAHNQIAGPDNPDTLTARNNLAKAYADGGQVDKAITIFEAALADLERVLGSEHLHTLRTRDNLAQAYLSSGQLDKGIDLCMNTLDERERVLSTDHPDSLSSRNNLGVACLSLGLLDVAISLLESAVTELERSLGSGHPKTLDTRSNLASAHKSSGNFDQAISFYASVLSDQERELGSDHPRTLNARIALGDAFVAAKQFENAIPLLKSVLADFERLLPVDNIGICVARGRLASVYQASERFDEAILLFEAAYADLEHEFHSDNPSALVTRGELANSYRAAGDFDKAIPMFEIAVADLERVLGTDNPNTLVTRHNLAYACRESGQLNKAIDIFETVLADSDRVFGDDKNPFTLTVRKNLEATRVENAR